MNAQTNTTPSGGGKPALMSSREIADLTGKQHQHVKRDIEKMLGELQEDASNFGRIYLDRRNREQTEYWLDRDHTEALLLGYSANARLAVIKRMREMEEALNNTRMPTTAEAFASVFQMVADSERRQAEHDATLRDMSARVEMIAEAAALPTKPQNTETLTEVRKRMRTRHGLPERIVDIVLTDLPYSPRPFAMVKNGHEDAKGSSFAVYRIKDITEHFDRFVKKCVPASPTTSTHPDIPGRFKVIRQ